MPTRLLLSKRQCRPSATLRLLQTAIPRRPRFLCSCTTIGHPQRVRAAPKRPSDVGTTPAVARTGPKWPDPYRLEQTWIECVEDALAGSRWPLEVSRPHRSLD